MSDRYSEPDGYQEFDEFSNIYSRQTEAPVDNHSLKVVLSEISENVQHFCNNVSTLERRVRLLHTSQDNARLRQEIIGLNSDTVQLAKIADTAIQKLKQNPHSLTAENKMQFGRLVNSFSSSVGKFQDIQKTTANLEQEMLAKARTSSIRKSSPDSTSSLPESEREDVKLLKHERSSQAQAQIISDSDALQVEQREREMRQLEHDIVDINQIFGHLGTMVHDQGDMIDNIEANVENTSARVVSGNKQLEKAVTHKRCSRKLTIIIVCIVVVVVVVLLIVGVTLVCVVGKFCNSK